MAISLWSSRDPILVNTTTEGVQTAGKVVALKDGTYLVVWQHQRKIGTVFDYDIRAQVFNADGTKKGDEYVINERTGEQADPDVAVLTDGRIVVTWVDKSGISEVYGDIRAQVLNADGTLSGADFSVATLTEGRQMSSSVSALADGGFAVTWTSQSFATGASSDIKVQAFKAPVGPAEPEKLGGEIFANTSTAGEQTEPAIAGLTNGNYAVVYRDTSGFPMLKARVIRPDGTEAVAEFIVSSAGSVVGTSASIAALADGRFIVTWEENVPEQGDNSGVGIKAQIFNANGTRSGGDFVINTSIQGSQETPFILGLPTGGFAAVYADYGPQSGIRVALFDSKGLRADEDFLFELSLHKTIAEENVPPGKVALRGAPTLTALEDGRLVLTWSAGGDLPQDSVGVYSVILEPRTKSVEIDGNGFNNSYVGTIFADTLSGKIGDDELQGAGGDDILIGGVGADKLYGGSGQDTASYIDAGGRVTASLQAPAINTGDASGDIYDSIENLTGSTFDDTLIGDDGQNVLNGRDGRDSLVGGKGDDILIGGDSATDTENDDTLDGGIGVDTLDGGKGNDTYYVDNAADKIIETVGAGSDVVIASASYALEEGIEIEELRAVAGSAAIDLTGNEFVNKLYGNVGDNILDGGLEADTLQGYAGNDTYIIDHAGDTVIEAAGDDQGFDKVIIGSDFQADHTYRLTAYENVEALEALNSAGDVNLTGNSGANLIQGNDGKNILDGGSAGLDTLIGGKGDDTYIIRDSIDIIREEAGEGNDTARVLTSSYELGKNLSIEIIKADTSGGVSDFALIGNNLANTIEGSDGNDELDGGGSSNDAGDRLIGGAGNDTYHVRRSHDIIVEADGMGSEDRIIAYANYALQDNAHIEIMQAADGNAKISLTGNAFSNKLIGNDGDNVLEGKGGNDDIDGGGGFDTAVFTGKRSDYTITRNDGGTYTVSDGTLGRDGTDTLRNIRYARFSDQIVDLQAPAIMSIMADNAVQNEGNGGGWTLYTFTISRTNGFGEASVNWKVVGAGASDDDFEFPIDQLTGKITFRDGQLTATVTVRVRADAADEGHETFDVTLFDLEGANMGTGTASAVILNDDAPATMSISAEDASKYEGDTGYTEYTFTVTRTSGAGTAKAVWTVKGVGTNPAQNDDFLERTGEVEFEEGETSKTITIMIRADEAPEKDETFAVVLSDAEGADILTGTAHGTITNDDVIPNTAPTNIRLTTGDTKVLVDENKSPGSVVATVIADDDEGTAGLRYYLVAVDDNFEIDEITGQIRIKVGANLNFEGVNTFTLSVRVQDLNGTGLYRTQDITINLADVNEAPVLGADVTAVTISENAAKDDTVASFTLTDVDADEDFIYEILGLPAAFAGAFAVDADNKTIVVADRSKLAVTGTQNFTLTLKVTDKKGGPGSYSDTKTFTITVQDVPPDNEGPKNIRLTTGEDEVYITESLTTGQSVAHVMADDDGPASELRYYLDDNPYFVIDQRSGEIKVKGNARLNYEELADGKHTVTVRVKDLNGVGKEAVQNITINIDDVNEAATTINFKDVRTVKAEATLKGASVARAEADDPDTKDEFRGNLYRFANGTTTDGLFTINAVTGQITTTRDVTSGDVGAHHLKVVAYDEENQSLTKAMTYTVHVADANNRAPTLTGVATPVAAQSNVGTVKPFTNVKITNEPGENLTVTIKFTDARGVLSGAGLGAKTMEGANAVYTISANSAEALQAILSGLVFDPRDRGTDEGVENTQFTLTIVDDMHPEPGLAQTGTVTVSAYAGQNRAPEVLSLSNAFVSEYAAPGATEIGVLSATDMDGDTLTYTLVDDAGGRFVISGDRLMLAGPGVNFEEFASHQIRVQVSDNKGGVSEQVFIINVGDETTLTWRGSKKNDKKSGTALDDILKGGTLKGKDTIKGLAGDDKIYGEGGDDKLYGGAGIDLVKGDAGNDLVKGDADNDKVYGGSGNDSVYGGAGNDKVYGDAGNDLVKGDAGNDTIYGGAGIDKLYGGSGQDVFVFNTKANAKTNLDQVKDFKVKDDTIWLDNKYFTKLGKAGSEAAPAALNKNFLRIGEKAKDKNDYIIYDKKTGILYYDADGSGKKAAVEIAKLSTKLKLTAADFMVI